MRQLSLFCALSVFIGLAFASDLNGTYKGTWVSDNQGRGDLTISFRGRSDSLRAEVSFTNEGQTIKCDVKSVKLDGSKLLLVMEYGAEGERYELTVSGVVDGKLLSGTYKTRSLADSTGDTGSWKASLT